MFVLIFSTPFASAQLRVKKRAGNALRCLRAVRFHATLIFNAPFASACSNLNRRRKSCQEKPLSVEPFEKQRSFPSAFDRRDSGETSSPNLSFRNRTRKNVNLVLLFLRDIHEPCRSKSAEKSVKVPTSEFQSPPTRKT